MDMFDTEKYESMFVHDYMVYPRMTIDLDNSMEDVVDQFEKSGAWNLVVLDGEKYLGFVSKSKVFTVYRSLLKEFSDH
jgi:CIC family chloride channel protein